MGEEIVIINRCSKKTQSMNVIYNLSPGTQPSSITMFNIKPRGKISFSDL